MRVKWLCQDVIINIRGCQALGTWVVKGTVGGLQIEYVEKQLYVVKRYLDYKYREFVGTTR